MESNEPYNKVFDGTGAIVGAVGGGVMTGLGVLGLHGMDKTYEQRVNGKWDAQKDIINDKISNIDNKIQDRQRIINKKNQPMVDAAKDVYYARSENNTKDYIDQTNEAYKGNNSGSRRKRLAYLATKDYEKRQNDIDLKHQEELNNARWYAGGKQYRKLMNQEVKKKNYENGLEDIEAKRSKELRRGSIYSRHLGGWKNAVAIGTMGAIGAATGGFATPALRRMDE